MSSTQPPVSPGIADLCFRFQSAFDSGQCPRIEVFLQETPLEERRAALRALLEVEWACRRKRGESIDDEEYGRRFPQQAGSIREWIYATDVPVNRPPRVVGIELPGYEIIRELGRGGMGVVFEALDVRLKRHVAVKMILSADLADSQELDRFQREAEVTARLAHEGVVQIHHVGSHRGRPFLVMELVEGGSLASKLRGKPVPAKQVATIASQLARAVDAAHSAGIIHRDLKPGNIFVGAGWKLKVGDFGLARRLDEPGQTRTGAVLGTPAYMAPEQAMGRKDIGLTADVWSLGAITYELLTGKPPFTGGSMMDILEAVIHRDPRHPSAINPKANADLSVIALKCLEKDPKMRYASAGDLAEDLERFLRHEPIRARPAGMMERLWKNVRRAPSRAGLIGLAMLAVVLLGVGWYFARQANWLQGLTTSLTKTHDAETEQRRLEDEQRLSDEADANRRIAESNRRAAYELALLRQGVLWACAPDEARQGLEDPATCPVDLRDVRHERLLTLCRRPATLIPEPTPLTESARAATAGSGVFLSPDGKVMARGTLPPAARVARHMGNQEFHLELVDLETGRVLHRLGTFPNQGQLDNQVAFSADGRTLAMAIPPKPGGFGGGNAFGPDKQWEVQLWDVTTGKEGNRFPLVAGACKRIAFRPGSMELVVLSTESTSTLDLLEVRKQGLFRQIPSRLTLYDTRTGDDRKLSGKDDQQITLIEFSADGSGNVTQRWNRVIEFHELLVAIKLVK